MSEMIKVEQPNLVAFVAKIEELVKQGYKVSGTNSGVPSSWGPGLYTCEMLPSGASEQGVEQLQEQVQPKQEEPVEPESNVSETPEKEAETESKVSEPAPKKTTTRRKKSSSKSTTS